MESAVTVFGQLCREFRIARSKTIAEQARHLGISPSKVSMLEQGYEKATHQDALAISKWLELDVTATEKLLKSIRAQEGRTVVNKEAVKLYRKINRLSPDEVRKLRDNPPDDSI